MRTSIQRLYLVGACLASSLLSVSAFAANADIKISVTPASTSVSVSRGELLPTYAAFEVKIENLAGNVSNQVLFTGSSAVLSSAPGASDVILDGQSAPFVESIPSTCTAGATLNSTVCNIGQLKSAGSPGSVASFVVLFKTSFAGTQVAFNWNGTYSNGASPGTKPSDFQSFNGNTYVGLITTDDPAIKAGLKSYIPSFGATFYTGKISATDADKMTTRITVPGQKGLTTAEINEESIVGGVTNDTLTTNTTTIKIPFASFFAQAATYELRRDSTTIRNFNAIDRVPLYYTSSIGEPLVLVNWEIPSCALAAVQPAPNATIPICLAGRTPITKKTPGATAEDVGDWLFVLKALQNGVSRW
jgi:hypothetical protein